MDIQYFWEVLAVFMPLVIPPLDAEFIILYGNIFPYFKLIISACPSKPRSIERLKNDDNGLIYGRIQPMHIQPFLFITISFRMSPLDLPENITFGFLFLGGSEGNTGVERVNSFFHIILFIPFHIQQITYFVLCWQ